MNESYVNPNNVFSRVRKMKMERPVVGGRYIRGNDGTHYLNKESANLWKAHM